MGPNIKAFFDARTYTLSYVVWDAETRDAVIIDPVLDYDAAASRTFTDSADELTEFVRGKELSLHYVLETHAHADHLSSSQLLRKRFDAQIAMSDQITAVQKTFKPIFDFGADFKTDGSQFGKLIADGESFTAGSLKISAIATPGHTPACMTFDIEGAVFVGDALFTEDYGTGRCDFPAGSADNLYDSIQKIYAFPDETKLYVGHDYQPGGREVRWETTVGESKASNPQIKGDTSRAQFVKFRTERDATLNAPRLLLQSVQVNINAGRLPAARENGHRYLNIPLNLLHPADGYGEPTKG